MNVSSFCHSFRDLQKRQRKEEWVKSGHRVIGSSGHRVIGSSGQVTASGDGAVGQTKLCFYFTRWLDGSMTRFLCSSFALACWTAACLAAEPGGGLIPAERMTDWRLAGVPAGGLRQLARPPFNRTKLLDVTKPPYNADNTGAKDAQPAIMQAIAKAEADDVVYLPAGTYRIEKPLGAFGGKSRITIRGAGPDKTFVTPCGPQSGGIGITPADGGDWWYENRLKGDISGSPAKGATVLTVGDTFIKALDGTPNGGIGQLCQIALKNDPKLPVVVPANFDYARKQISRIVAKTATTVTISPGLLFDLPAELAPQLRPGGRYAEFVGIEDLTLDAANSPTPHALASMEVAYGCWIKNVTVLNVPNYSIGVSGCVQCEVRHCYVAKRKGAGSNGAGILVGQVSFCLFEDNVLLEQFPHIEVNGSSGNVFSYNFCQDSDINGVIGVSICSNHGAHSSFNLYEGNVSPKFQSDGYHGSASHDTAFRNWFHGTSEKTNQFGICVYLNRFTRYYSLVGNVLGRKGLDYKYDNAENGFGYDDRFIYVFGLPNIGNGGFKGTVQPSKGKLWADWDKMLASPRGKGPGPNGFQELDLDVKATTLLKGNYNYKDNGVPESEALGGAALPPSLYLKEKPAWFGDLTWPPFGPDTEFAKNKIPAQVRFEAQKKNAER